MVSKIVVRLGKRQRLCTQQYVRKYEDDMLITLLSEIEQLQSENAELRQELETWWEIAHDEGCTNMNDCASYGGNKICYCPRPEILKKYKVSGG